MNDPKCPKCNEKIITPDRVDSTSLELYSDNSSIAASGTCPHCGVGLICYFDFTSVDLAED